VGSKVLQFSRQSQTPKLFAEHPPTPAGEIQEIRALLRRAYLTQEERNALYIRRFEIEALLREENEAGRAS
jgi:hypothetical protein